MYGVIIISNSTINLKQQFFNYLTETNITRVKLAAILGIIIEACLLARNIYFYGISFHYYVQLYLAMLLASALVLVAANQILKMQNQERKYRLAHYIMLAYYLFILIWGVLVTLLDQLSYGHVTAYLTNLLIAVTLFVCSLRTFFVLHVIPFSLLMGSLLYMAPTDKALSGHLINIFCFVMFAVLGSRTIFVHTEKIFKQGILLNEKNEQLYELNRDLEFYANRDPLTGLANRYCLENYLNRMLQANQQIAIFIFDIDYFKLYNDFYGHLKGDEVLKSVSNQLMRIANDDQLFACRLGGEEFVLLGFGLSYEKSTALAQKIKTAINALQIPHDKSPVDAHVTISLGYTVQKLENIQHFTEFLNIADQALYMAKDSGRNEIKFSSKALDSVKQ